MTERIFILAGGKGTRLQSTLGSKPKILAPVLDRTFLDVLLDQLYTLGFRKYVFLLGHLHEQVSTHLKSIQARYNNVEIETSVELTPSGTAGALKHAEEFCNETFFVMNGDTYLDFDPYALLSIHRQSRALVTIASRQVDDASRYGTLGVDGEGRVHTFREKCTPAQAGLISTGLYVLDSRVLRFIPRQVAVSIELETFPRLLAADEKIQSLLQQGPFFDIGTPASYSEFEDFLNGQHDDTNKSGQH